jgi:hypothetical protein
LPENYVESILNWSSEFEDISNIFWNRFAGIENPKRVQLYGCCDASSYALGACIYLVSTSQTGEIIINLILSKTRNAPPTEHSIPRLELSAALLLTNLMAHVRKVYQVDEKDIAWFTDSADVLFWLYSGHLSWKPFVANQVKKIKKCSEVQSWRHIDTKENPADLASRGETINNLAASRFWNSGPTFWKTGDLNKGASTLKGYDKHYENLEMTKNCGKEMQPETKRQLSANMSPVHTIASISRFVEEIVVEKNVGWEEREIKLKLDMPRIDRVIDTSRLINSEYDYLMRISDIKLRFMQKYIENWKKCLLEKGKEIPKTWIDEKLTFCSENANVELMWIQAIQRKYFAEIFLILENPKAKVSAFSRALVTSHAIFLDKDMKILRCTTRNEKSILDYSSVYPILLPSSVRTAEGGWEDCEFTKN